MAKKRYKYSGIPIAQLSPRLMKIKGRLVGIGGDYIIAGRPPQIRRTISEATQEDYEELYNSGSKLVIREENKAAHVSDSKSDTQDS